MDLLPNSLCCSLASRHAARRDFNQTRRICVIPDLLQADGLLDLLIVVGVLPAGGQLLEGVREDLALAVPGAANGLEQLEDWAVRVNVGILGFRLAFFKGHGAWGDKCDLHFLRHRRGPGALFHLKRCSLPDMTGSSSLSEP